MILCVVQVSTVVGAVMVAVGSAVFCVIAIVAVFVQPFDAVTVTVYVPATLTLKVLFVVPPVQR